VVVAFAAIVDKEVFQERCHTMRRSLGVGGGTSTLGDGAKGIGNVSRAVFGKTEECWDIYHGAEHLSDCGKKLFGESGSKEWLERMRLVLLSEGFSGMERELLLLWAGMSKRKTAKRKAVISLWEYLRNNEGRLSYPERLSMERVMGRGLIEGAWKNLVGKRLKQTGACGRLTRANRMAGLAALLYFDQWKHVWSMST
jgi:hypothetical protein